MHGLGEKRAYFHCDNCAGQSKNQFLMFHMMYRVAYGLHDDIKILFLVVDHTKLPLIGVLAFSSDISGDQKLAAWTILFG